TRSPFCNWLNDTALPACAWADDVRGSEMPASLKTRIVNEEQSNTSVRDGSAPYKYLAPKYFSPILMILSASEADDSDAAGLAAGFVCWAVDPCCSVRTAVVPPVTLMAWPTRIIFGFVICGLSDNKRSTVV